MKKESIINKELSIDGLHGRAITFDISYLDQKKTVQKPVIIYCHGFKGFKDWGANQLMAQKFASNNFLFLKFNFSHNGTSVNQFDDLHDLEAFGNNNFEIELDDVKCLVDWLHLKDNPFKSHFNSQEIYLIGHSRGGGIAMLSTVYDQRIKKVVSWAGVNDLEKYMYLSDIETWKKEGISWVENSRTGQSLPLYYQFYENFYAHKNKFDIKFNLMKLDKPLLLLHGDKDKTVDFSDSHWIYEHIVHSILVKVENSDHTFGAKHPWEKDVLPEKLNFAIEETIEFFNF